MAAQSKNDCVGIPSDNLKQNFKKMNKFGHLLCIGAVMLVLVASGYGQQTDLRREQQIEELVESLAVTEDGSSEGSLLLDDLSYLTANPIFINKATEEDLIRLNLFNFRQIRAILNYRERYGKILTLDELSVLGGFGEELLSRMKPFVLFEVERDSMQKKKDLDLHQSMLFRVKGMSPVAAGYASANGKQSAYPGAPCSYFTRYRGTIGHWLDFGITGENDAGEDFFKKSNKQGFDFLSGFVNWNGAGHLRKIVLGDFHLRFGQGISLWSGGGTSYGSDLSSMMKTSEGIRPYSSSDESQFFRGAAVQVDLKPVALSLFFSGKRQDANLTADSTGRNFISSLRLDGLHRTVNELSDEKNVKERMFGGYGDVRFEKWRFGILACCSMFETPITRGDLPYKSKTFEGAVNINFGMDYQVILRQISLFGEVGMSQNLKLAVVNGLIWKAHPQLSVSLLHRKYNPGFQTFHSGAFSEGSGGRNEEGFMAAIEVFPLPKIKMRGQADLFYFPWITYQTISPSKGRTCSFQVDCNFRQDLACYFYLRFVLKPQKLSGATGVPEQYDEGTAKWRIHGDWKISDKIQLRSRLDCVRYKFNGSEETGFLIFQDFIGAVSASLKVWFRMAYYRTDGYNSRVFSYENDLLYYFAIPVFYGEGVRSYLNLKWQPTSILTVYLKAGYTLRQGAIQMGSGNDATLGNHRFDFRGQLCFKF